MGNTFIRHWIFTLLFSTFGATILSSGGQETSIGEILNLERMMSGWDWMRGFWFLQIIWTKVSEISLNAWVEEDIYRAIKGSIPYKVVVCGVRNNGGGEREFITEESEECIPLVLWSETEGSICITSNKDCSCRMLFEEFINSSFKNRYFVNKITVKTSCREVNSNMNRDRVAGVIKNYGKNSTGWNIDSFNEWIKLSFPENKDASMSMGGGEGEFVVMLVIGVKITTIFRQEEWSSRVKIRLEQPRLRDKDEVWVSVCTDVE